MNVIGIDLAWQSAKNTSAAAVGFLDDGRLSVHELNEELDSIEAIFEFVAAQSDVWGIAIDAPLIINNETGQRACERALSRVYGARKASCHTSNLSLYPEPPSVRLANELKASGFEHLGDPEQTRWQIECYPHPAIIEVFGLPERHQYKKGSVEQKRGGQIRLAHLILQLSDSPVLELSLDDQLMGYLEDSAIGEKRGAALKKNEDALDAIICTYIAGLYALQTKSTTFGDSGEGYIYVPQEHCLPAVGRSS